MAAAALLAPLALRAAAANGEELAPAEVRAPGAAAPGAGGERPGVDGTLLPLLAAEALAGRWRCSPGAGVDPGVLLPLGSAAPRGVRAVVVVELDGARVLPRDALLLIDARLR